MRYRRNRLKVGDIIRLLAHLRVLRGRTPGGEVEQPPPPDPDPEPPPPPPDASYVHYDDFAGTNDTSIDGRELEHQPTSGITWDVMLGTAEIQSNNVQTDHSVSVPAFVVANTARSDEAMRLQFQFSAEGTNRQVAILMRVTDEDNYLQAICNFDQGYFRIVRSTAGVWTNLRIANVTYDQSKTYVIRFGANGDQLYARLFEWDGSTETGIVADNNTLTISETQGNTQTLHGFRLTNSLGAAGSVVHNWASYDPAPVSVPDLADVTATVSGSSYRTSNTHMSITIVDNNLNTNFTGAGTQKAEGLTNLAGEFHHVNMFIDSFGNGQSLSDWNGQGTMPELDTSVFEGHFNVIDTALTPDTWGVFMYRIPWQFTGYTNDSGQTTLSTSADYNSDSRRLLTNRSDDYVEWVARVVELCLGLGITVFYWGSEGKNFQRVIPVVVNGVTIRAAKSQSWEYDSYEGTPGRADMGGFHNFKLFYEGVELGVSRAAMTMADVRVISPYPVIAHRGVETGASNIRQDSWTDESGMAIDVSDINVANTLKGGWGGVAKAASVWTIEHVSRLRQEGYDTPTWEFGSDFGTHNTDNIPTNVQSHELAYRRAKGHFRFYRKLLNANGFSDAVIRLPEYYAKAHTMAELDSLSEENKYKFQAGVRAVFLMACYEEGIDYPDMWSPFGRGDQAADAGIQSDPRQWYGGMIKRTVTDNGDHSGTAVTDGGSIQAAWYVINGFKENFPPGTALHNISFSTSQLRGIASPTKAAIVNQTGQTLTLSIDGGNPITFAPYEFKVVDH